MSVTPSKVYSITGYSFSTKIGIDTPQVTFSPAWTIDDEGATESTSTLVLVVI